MEDILLNNMMYAYAGVALIGFIFRIIMDQRLENFLGKDRKIIYAHKNLNKNSNKYSKKNRLISYVGAIGILLFFLITFFVDEEKGSLAYLIANVLLFFGHLSILLNVFYVPTSAYYPFVYSNNGLAIFKTGFGKYNLTKWPDIGKIVINKRKGSLADCNISIVCKDLSNNELALPRNALDEILMTFEENGVLVENHL